MNKLECFLSNSKEIKSAGSEKEREIDKLGRNILKLLDKLYPGEKYEKEWKLFDNIKAEFIDKLKDYCGNFSDYFKNMLEEIKEQERQALGYHIHSD